jgi:hypothetical protein
MAGTRAGMALKRRGILAAAGAVVAGLLAKQAASPVTATSGAGPDGTLVMGSNFSNTPNTEQQLTVIIPSTGGFAAPHSPIMFDVDGVGGAAAVPNLNAIYGNARGAGTGVIGVNGGTTGQNSTTLGNAGVAGYSFSSGGTGVLGVSVSGSGVVGGSSSATAGLAGGQFYNTVSNGSAVIGQIFGATTGAAAFVGAAAPGNFAAFFTGDVHINGRLAVSDPSYKSGLVKTRSGGDRLVYCVEAPESWLMDFGEGKVSGGKADVQIDADFASVIDTNAMHVFVTPHGDFHLHVAQRTATGFTAQVTSGTGPAASGGVSGTFSYTVIGKTKDSKSTRFELYKKPEIKVPPMTTLPKTAEAPKGSDARP